MTRARRPMERSLATLAVLLACATTPASAADAVPADSAAAPPLARPARTRPRLEALVPELAEHPYRIAPGPRPYQDRLSVSPAFGTFGSDRLFALRVAYNPERWLGYEASLAHDPGHSVHAMLHTLSAIVRRPFPGRLQPYLTAGYGMIVVFPGQAVNAASVTKNAVAAGGGLELYIRNDLALRADLRRATVFGQQRDRSGTVVYDYSEGTVGLAFYRSIRP